MPKKLTYKFVKEVFEKEDYILLTKEYRNSKQQLKYICNNGHIGSIIWKNWQQGRRCPKCANENKRLNIDYIRTSFEAEGYVLLDTVYSGALSKLKYKCSNGHIGFVRWTDWQQGCRCKICSIEKRRIGIDKVRNSFESEGYILLTNTYINGKIGLNYICPNGHENTTTWCAWTQGCRCPDCNKITIDKVKSSFESEGYILLSSDYINAHKKLKYRCPFYHEHSISWANWHAGNRCKTCAIINNSGLNCALWKGGISCDPYCDAWLDKEYKQDIKDRDGNRCLNPDCWGKDKLLSIHHINYEKKDCKPSNLITICRSCNSRANKDRRWHNAWYQAIIKNRYQIGA